MSKFVKFIYQLGGILVLALLALIIEAYYQQNEKYGHGR